MPTVVRVFTATGPGSDSAPPGSSEVTIEVIGAAGDAWWSGGGGGGYSKTPNIPISPSQTIYFNVGLGAHLSSGTDSWANVNSNAAPTLVTQGALAKGGEFQTFTVTSLGGQASAGVGVVKYSGGDGSTVPPAGVQGGSGGGAAGPNGPGGAGGMGDGVSTGYTGGSGGAANGGANGNDFNGTPGGIAGPGANNRFGTGGGAAATVSTPPIAGVNGASGGGGFQAGDTSQQGSTEVIPAWGPTYGPGSGSSQADNVGSGGLYGGGTAFYGASVGTPGQGIVVLTYFYHEQLVPDNQPVSNPIEMVGVEV